MAQTSGHCSVETCDRGAFARNWCQAHYNRWRIHGDVQSDRPLSPRSKIKKTPPLERIARKSIVQPCRVPGLAGDCWVWTGVTNGVYGSINVDQKSRYVHRVSFEELIDDIPEGLDIDHLCRNKLCWNPWHLDPVTRQVNLFRGEGAPGSIINSDTCPNGHPLTPENRIVYGPDGRYHKCRTCRNDYARASNARRRTEKKEVVPS